MTGERCGTCGARSAGHDTRGLRRLTLGDWMALLASAAPVVGAVLLALSFDTGYQEAMRRVDEEAQAIAIERRRNEAERP